MVKSFFLICLLSHFTVVLYGQVPSIKFQKTYGGNDIDGGRQVYHITGGGFIMVGYTRSFGVGDKDIYVIKTNEEGTVVWSKVYGGLLKDAGEIGSIFPTTDGGYIINSPTLSYGQGGYDIYLLKINSIGDTLWTTTIGNGGIIDDGGFSIQQTADKGYIIGGYSNYGSYRDYLIKLDSTGTIIWNKMYGGGIAYSVQQTTDGGYILAGTTTVYGAGSSDFRLIKTNNVGDTLWTKTYGGINYESVSSVRQTSDGGYILTGYTRSFGAGDDDFYLIKTDGTGNLIWSKTYGGTSRDVGMYAEQTIEGGYIVVGVNDTKACLIKTNSLGDTLWTKAYGNNSSGYFVKQLSDKGFVLCGEVGNDVYLIRTDSLGNSGCLEFNTQITIGNPSTQIGKGATVISNCSQTRPGTIITTPATHENVICFEHNCFLQVSFEGDTSICFNSENGIINAIPINGTAPFTYTWNTDLGIQSESTLSQLPAGTYSITIGDVSGCNVIDSITITQTEALNVAFESNNLDENCNGTITVNVNGGTPDYSYLWDTNANDQTTQTAINLCLENYCVTITDFNDCAIDTCIINLPVNLIELRDNVFISPNPATTEITVNGYSPAYLKLCNAVGQTVAESTSNKLYVGNLSQGLYVLQVFDAKGQQVKTEKVIVAK